MAKNNSDAYAYQPGDKSVYINFDAIKDLPEEFEVVVTEVLFDPKNLAESFSNVGSNNNPAWQPKVELMYKIAEACGISGGDESETQPMVEEVDINPMLMKPMDAPPTYRRMTVGRSVSKRSSRLMEDGSLLWSSLCTSEYNVWERCNELWSKEESYTEGYKKASKYDNKYDNPYKRRAHFDSEMKFAHAKAETKAYVKSIRELAGMPTGYATADLASGKFVFARIRRSKMVLKMETAARISAISRGQAPQPAPALFAPEEPIYDDLPVTEPEPEPAKKETHIVALFEEYLPNISDLGLAEEAQKTLDWLKTQEDPKAKPKFYAKALDNLKRIEDAIPEAFRIQHNLYQEAN